MFRRKFEKYKKLIEKSGLFNSKFYLKTYRDARVASETPLDHFIKVGLKENRKPNEWFDPVWYKNFYKDVEQNDIYPFIHFIKYGNTEFRYPNLTHYTKYENHLNSLLPLFDEESYLNANEDIYAAIQSNLYDNGFDHLRKIGLMEVIHGKRRIGTEFPYFTIENYVQTNNDISDMDPLFHFCAFGYREFREKSRKLGGGYSFRLTSKMIRQLKKHIDMEAYLNANDDLKRALENKSIKNIFTHFLEYGIYEVKQGKRKIHPSIPAFTEEEYIFFYNDVYEALRNKTIDSPFEHFLFYGYSEILEGKRPIFKQYGLELLSAEKKLSINATIVEMSGYFDTEYYLEANPDIATANIDPLRHYLSFGTTENRNPNPYFNTSFYYMTYPDVQSSKLHPLIHYILIGNTENRKTLPAQNSDDPKVELLNLPLTLKHIEKKFKIAVVIHAFYIDVLKDIIDAVSLIDPIPDLFISVAKDANISEIRDFLTQKGFQRVTIKAVPNRGRDVAPFIAEFSQELKSYDLCCKIHGKKSLYAGSEQSNWRNHLYYNLLGNKEIVRDIINAFAQDEKLGLLFSDNYGMLPYWGYTWLTNKEIVRSLLHRLDLLALSPILNKTYIDYPAGTMFWFRPDAIKQILDSGLNYEDFPEEPIGNDGTIAHGLERLFAYVTRLNGYDYIEQNWKRKTYTKNITHKNFNQHEAKTLDTAKRIVSEKECIIFDIFDTLVTRTIFYPDNLFRIIEEEFDKKFGIKSNFMKVRKETEYQLRISGTHTGDVSYEDIYEHLHLHSDYTEEMIDYLREKDFAYELEILIPKAEVISLLKHAYDQNIDILFVSDMYLTKQQIITILEKHNIPFKKENILVSSDTGYRKDNSSVWKHLVDTKRIDPSKTLMIGDSEVSDAKLPGDFGIETFHIFSEKNTFFESPYGKAFTRRFGTVDEIDMLLLGPIINQLFASPFSLPETMLNFSKKCTPYTFGYTALAPFFYMFTTHLYQKFNENKIYFLARDGYFIKEAFEHMLKSKGLSLKSETSYLQISRRAMLGAVIKTEENLKNMILNLGNYEGMFSAMLYSRVGLDAGFLEECGIDDFEIKDVPDLEKAYEVLLEHLDEINAHARSENEAYMAYLDSIDFFKESEDVLVDLGYSGTIQNYLHQLSGKKLIGEYFVTTQKVSAVESAENVLEGYFADKIDPADNSNIVYKYALILEAFLTSDKGQLICFKKEEDKIIPQYKEKHESLAVQREIMRGIRDYISALSIVPVDFIDTKNEKLKEISLFSFEYILRHRLLDEELTSIFYLEDEFTGNKALDILSILDQRGI